MADQIGSAEFELRARREQLKADLKDAERDLKGFVDNAETEGNRGAVGVNRAVRGMATAVTAVVAVFAAAATGAFYLGKASLAMAEDIQNSARRIGVGTAALQEFQYVARKTGEDALAVDAALESFGNKLASAAAGLSKEDLKTFQSIGFTQEQLRSFDDTEKALDEVIDRIGALSSEADRGAIAEKLGLGPLATALREGSDEVTRLRDEAADLGFVMDAELIRKGAAAAEQMDDLSKIIGIQMAEAFINLSDEVLAFTGWIAGAINKLNDFAGAYERFEQKGQALTQANTLRLQGAGNAVGALFRGDFGGVRAGLGQMGDANSLYWRIQRGEGFDNDDPAQVNQQMPPPPRPPRTGGGGYGSGLTIPQRAGREDNSAQRAAEREARRAERIEQEIYRARQRLLQVAQDDVLTAQQRFTLAQDQLRMDRDARDAEIESKATRGEIKDAERKSLVSANAEADALEDRILADNAFRELQDERIANERLLGDLTANLLSLQSAGARTARERQKIELELLELTQRQRRDALQLELDRNPSMSAADRARAMATNGRIESAERAAVVRSNLSPLGAWRDESLSTAEQINEAYENVAARGLDALNGGIVDAIMNSKSLGETFHNVANQIIADLIAIGVRQQFTEPLAGFLFGDGKSAGSSGKNLLSSIGGFLGGLRIPGFSSGVSNFSGGLAYVHQGEVLANLAPGTDVIPAHALGGGGTTNVFQGNLMTPEFWAKIQSGDRNAAQYGRSNGAMDGARIVAGSADRQQRQNRMYKK